MSAATNPFASPQVEDAVRPTKPGATWRYVSPSLRTHVAIGVFTFAILCTLLAIVTLCQQLNLLAETQHRAITFAKARTNDLRVQWAATLQTAAQVAAIVAFLFWLYRVHGNLHALGHQDLDHSRAWAFCCWFIPLINLFIPCVLMLEIWKKSDPASPPTSVRRPPASAAVVGLWWFFHLLIPFAWIVLESGARLARHDAVASTYFSIANYAAVLPAALLVVLMMWRIGRMQEDRSEIPWRDTSEQRGHTSDDRPVAHTSASNTT